MSKSSSADVILSYQLSGESYSPEGPPHESHRPTGLLRTPFYPDSNSAPC